MMLQPIKFWHLLYECSDERTIAFNQTELKHRSVKRMMVRFIITIYIICILQAEVDRVQTSKMISYSHGIEAVAFVRAGTECRYQVDRFCFH